jgi:hypothetical protein
MNNVESTSRSTLPSKDRSWLKEVYDLKRSRTVELVKSSVDSLMQDRKRVSLATLSARSKEIDRAGSGISESAILKNQEARIYYEQHRSWRKARSGNRQGIGKSTAIGVPARIKSDRDSARVRYRYLKLHKTDLVERLLTVEQAYAALQEQWFALNEEVLSWRLRAERSEPQPRRREECPRLG